jgi:hypothetical protein
MTMRKTLLSVPLVLVAALLLAVPALANFGFQPGAAGYDATYTNADGSPVTQAGAHPYAFTTTINFTERTDPETGEQVTEGDPRDVLTNLPAGLVGNPTVVAQCSQQQFHTASPSTGPDHRSGPDTEDCPFDSQVGVVALYYAVNGEPPITQYFGVYNLVPPPGAPAAFGFNPFSAAVTLVPHLRSNGDYGLTVDSINTSQGLAVHGVTLAIWGVPYDPSHDGERGACLSDEGGSIGESCPAKAPPVAFITMPSECAGPLESSVLADSWQQPAAYLPSGEPDLSDPNWLSAASLSHDSGVPPQPLGLSGCNKVPFTPSSEAAPTTDRASAPTGLDFNLDVPDEGLLSPTGTAQSDLKRAVVTLPEGLTINPSAGVGLGGCSEADYARETIDSEAGAGCPNDSKLGEVTIETPLLAQTIHGSLFIAQPHENPFGSLVALYVVAKNPETGIMIKLAGEVTPNRVTGQLTTTFDNNPQLPFDHFNFHFREGQQAPLISPQACGTYNTTAQLSPWSEPTAALTETSSFTITKGFDGGACPAGGISPFHPQIEAGLLNNNAGAFSAFYLHLTRSDAESEISGFSTDLPAGLTGDLSGIPFCPEAAIALARTKSGAQEEANPSCPAASQIGHTLVGTGVGAVLAYVPGKIYLAGPYNGDPFSLVSVTSAVVGPFDLGTVVVRFGLRIDPHTAQVSVDPTASEPIPTIIDGIVTHVRDIRVYIDRAGFTLNPTNCSPLTVGSTLSSSLGQHATVTSPFQSTNCANLKFAPKFAVTTSGKTSKAQGASLSVKLTYPSAAQGTYANIAKVKVDLPKQLPSRLTTLQKACTALQFETNPAGCPAASVVGHARAVTPLIPVPLEGPAYFVSHGGEAFPSLIVVLQGYGVTVDLVGSTFISHAGITSSTFKTVPDQPVASFELTLPQGKFSALAANGNLCKAKLVMPTAFTAQNGAELHQSTKIAVSGCPKAKKAKRAKRQHKAKGKKGKGGSKAKRR